MTDYWIVTREMKLQQVYYNYCKWLVKIIEISCTTTILDLVPKIVLYRLMLLKL
jgi:hypothetical protein